MLRENNSVGNFSFLFKHFGEVPSPKLNWEVKKKLVDVPVHTPTGPLGHRFLAHSSLRGELGQTAI